MAFPVAFIDPRAPWPWLHEVGDATGRQDWGGLVALMDRHADTLDAFTDLAEAVAEVKGAEDWLEQVVKDSPGDIRARCLLAERTLALAWELRSSQRAKYLTEEQIAGHQRTLRRLEGWLRDWIARDPAQPFLWSARITSGMGLGVGLTEIRRRYKRLEALAPLYYRGALRHLTALLPKWYGTLEDSLAFARQRAAAAPEGSLLRALPVEFYADRWLMDPEAEVVPLLKRREVRDELVAAARGSVLSSAHVAVPRTGTIHSTLALLLCKGDWWADAWPHFAALGTAPVKASWGLVNNPTGAYAQFYDRAREAGER